MTSVDADRHAFASELVDNIQHAELPAVMGTVLDKIIGPDVVGVLWSKPHAGSVVQPEASLLRLPLRHFEPLSPPNPFDALDVHGPARQPGGLHDLEDAGHDHRGAEIVDGDEGGEQQMAAGDQAEDDEGGPERDEPAPGGANAVRSDRTMAPVDMRHGPSFLTNDCARYLRNSRASA